MSKRSLLRLVSVLLICASCGYFFLPLDKVKLGLDLKGGVHFMLEVQGQEALEADLRDTRDRLSARLAEKGFPSALVRLEGSTLKVEGVPAEQKSSLEKQLATASGYAIAWQDGNATLTQTSSYQQTLKQEANERAKQIVENRVNAFGVAEAEITSTGAEGNRIQVEIPGVSEAERDRIKILLSTPGRLEMRLMAKNISEDGFPTREDALAAAGGTLPADLEILYEPESDRSARLSKGRMSQAQPAAPRTHGKKEDKPRRWYVVESRVQVDGKDIVNAYRAPNPVTGSPQVHFQLNTAGGEAFYQLTSRVIDEGRRMAIVLDRKVLMVLGSHSKIAGGSAFIDGTYTPEEADDLARQLKSGALRASMKTLEEKSMGPGLGADSIKSGVFGSLLGFGTIILFMVIWYHWSGVNAIVALTVNTIVMLGLMGSLHAVLTLPGIAGFALTLGMAVDANILIYERIREELAAGKSVAGAISAGFDRVFWTIVDSHVTQLAAALLLYSFGTTAVKGFAVTLTIGVVASLFTSIYISRFIYDWILERHPGAKTISIGSLHVFKNATFPFMKYKGLAIAISWSIVVACILAAQPWKGSHSRVKLGMQFVGGVDAMVRYQGKVPTEKVREALTKGGMGNATLVAYADRADATDFSIKLKAKPGQDAKEASLQFQQILGALKHLDPQAGDPRKDLNLEDNLSSHWMAVNPLAVQGDEEALRRAYAPWAESVRKVREDISPLRNFTQLPGNLPAQLRQDIEKNYRLGPMMVLKNESFSPSISGEWTKKTLMATGLALAAILVYVMLRFTASFAVGGIVALIHDILMALGLFVAFGFEFSVPVVASFLILIGYSMADTIVVFDRIRENMHKPEYRRVPIAKLVDDSINQTLSRTILTSCSVLFVAGCLFFWGGSALRDLSFPLLIGVITGTYSSIYIASPVVVYWDKWFGGKDRFKHH